MKKQPQIHQDVYSLPQFCKLHGISLSTFYKFRDEMPDTFHVGSRHLITRESAERWRSEREKDGADA